MPPGHLHSYFGLDIYYRAICCGRRPSASISHRLHKSASSAVVSFHHNLAVLTLLDIGGIVLFPSGISGELVCKSVFLIENRAAVDWMIRNRTFKAYVRRTFPELSPPGTNDKPIPSSKDYLLYNEV